VRREITRAAPAQRSGRILCITSNEDSSALARAFGETSIVGRAGLPQIDRQISLGAVRAIIYELSTDVGGEPRLPDDIVSSSDHIPLLIRARLAPASVREIARLASLTTHFQVSLIGYDDVAHDLGRLLRRDGGRPDRYIIERAVRCAAPGIRDILTTAAIIGRRRATVGVLAAHCSLAERTLEARCEKEGVVPANRLLGSIGSLYALWSLDVRGHAPKTVADSMGFRSAGTLANYMNRHLGGRIREMKSKGFWVALEAFEPVAR
jgi:hypothetical protein